MQKLLAMILLGSLLAVGGCSRSVDQSDTLRSELAAKERQVAELTRQVDRQEAELAQLKQDLNKAKQASPPPPVEHAGQVAAGRGDGRFVVIPSTIRPGDTIAIYNDFPGGQVRIFQRDTDKTMAELPGPKEHNFALFTFPKDWAEGTYVVTILGPGGWQGQAEITVEDTE